MVTKPAFRARSASHRAKNVFPQPYSPRTALKTLPPDAYGHAGNGTFKPSEEPSRAYLWICPSLEIVAAIVAQVSAGFANDYLQVPQGVTAEWVGRIVRAVVDD